MKTMKTMKEILAKSKEMIIYMNYSTVGREERYLKVDLISETYKCFDIEGNIYSIKEDTVIDAYLFFDEEAFTKIEEKAKENRDRKKDFEERKKKINRTFSQFSQLLD